MSFVALVALIRYSLSLSTQLCQSVMTQWSIIMIIIRSSSWPIKNNSSMNEYSDELIAILLITICSIRNAPELLWNAHWNTPLMKIKNKKLLWNCTQWPLEYNSGLINIWIHNDNQFNNGVARKVLGKCQWNTTGRFCCAFVITAPIGYYYQLLTPSKFISRRRKSGNAVSFNNNFINKTDNNFFVVLSPKQNYSINSWISMNTNI